MHFFVFHYQLNSFYASKLLKLYLLLHCGIFYIIMYRWERVHGVCVYRFFYGVSLDSSSVVFIVWQYKSDSSEVFTWNKQLASVKKKGGCNKIDISISWRLENAQKQEWNVIVKEIKRGAQKAIQGEGGWRNWAKKLKRVNRT